MESDSSARIEIPANFEDAPVDYLVQLIGVLSFHLQLQPLTRQMLYYIADMIDRLMSHNDLIPLSPYVAPCFLSLVYITMSYVL